MADLPEPVDAGPAWDARALHELTAASYAEAVVLTDGDGRVIFSERRRALPEPLGVLTEALLVSQALAGQRFGLGAMHIAASLHEAGTLVCGKTLKHSLLVLASDKANLGQLLRHVRRVFPRQGDA